jgi:hypothetical protein
MFLKECASHAVCLTCGSMVFGSVEVVDFVGVAGGRKSKMLESGATESAGSFVRTEGD